MNKDVRRLVRELQRLGCDVRRGGRGHWQVRYRGRLVTTFPSSPSCSRWERNCRADLVRAGVPVSN